MRRIRALYTSFYPCAPQITLDFNVFRIYNNNVLNEIGKINIQGAENEKDLPAQEETEKQSSRFQKENGHNRRKKSVEEKKK